MNVVLARHGADPQSTWAFMNPREFTHLIHIDDVVGHDKSKIHHGHQGLSARKNFIILQCGNHLERFTQLGRTMVLKTSRFHASKLSSGRSAQFGAKAAQYATSAHVAEDITLASKFEA